MRHFFALILLACLLPGNAPAEEEYHFVVVSPRPSLVLISPADGSTWGAGGVLAVSAAGNASHGMEARLEFDGGSLEYGVEGGVLEHTFEVRGLTGPGLLAVTAYGGKDEYGADMSTTVRVAILSPRDKLIADMLDEARRNSTDRRYIHAPAQEDYHIGVCKNYVMRLFDTFKNAYAMLEYPSVPLYMPKNKSKADSAPYDYGIEWRPDTAEQGNPFEIAAQFKYDASLTKEQNEALCRTVLENVRKGDFFQMTGDYYYGNGPHSLLFMADYDSNGDILRWTDSNMKGDRVNGERWGYLQYDASRTAEWFVNAICTRNRGCTLYRLRADLIVR